MQYVITLSLYTVKHVKLRRKLTQLNLLYANNRHGDSPSLHRINFGTLIERVSAMEVHAEVVCTDTIFLRYLRPAT